MGRGVKLVYGVKKCVRVERFPKSNKRGGRRSKMFPIIDKRAIMFMKYLRVSEIRLIVQHDFGTGYHNANTYTNKLFVLYNGNRYQSIKVPLIIR